MYKCTQNQFTEPVYKNQFTMQVYTKPVYYTSIHTTSLLCKCTQNQSTVQMYKKVGQRQTFQY